MQEVVGFLITIYCNFTQVSSGEKIVKRLRLDRTMAMSLWPHIIGPPCSLLLALALLNVRIRKY